MKLFLALFLIQSTSLFAQDNELPAISVNNISFFIPTSVCQRFHLEAGQTDEWMKVYNNPETDGAMQRVNDIRWQGKDKAEASQWYSSNKQLLSEDGEDITSQLSKPSGVDNWNVYAQSKQMRDLMKSLGLEQNQYDFTFTIDKYVGKIFVATSGKTNLKDVWQLVKEGIKATLTASGKPELAKQVL